MAQAPRRPGSANFADRLRGSAAPTSTDEDSAIQNTATLDQGERDRIQAEANRIEAEETEQQERRDRAKENTDAMRANSEGQAPLTTNSPAGEQQTTQVTITTLSEHPDDQKIGNVMPSSTRVGADDSNPRVTSDTAAESSTLTRNQQDTVLGRGPSPQDQLPSQVGREAIDREIAAAKTAQGDEDAEVRYFYSDYPNMGIQAGRRGTKRAVFRGRVLATSDPEIIKHIEENHLDKGRQFRIREISEDEYRENREGGYEAPTITTLRDVRMMGQKRELVAAALQARAPRTDANPAVMEPETGNAQQDHFTQAALLIGQERPETSTGNVQLQRNQQTLNELRGAPPKPDAQANAPAPGGNTQTGAQASRPKG